MPQQTTKKSTLFRMIYLHQPIAGLLTKNSQLFSGRVSGQSNYRSVLYSLGFFSVMGENMSLAWNSLGEIKNEVL